MGGWKVIIVSALSERDSERELDNFNALIKSIPIFPFQSLIYFKKFMGQGCLILRRNLDSSQTQSTANRKNTTFMPCHGFVSIVNFYDQENIVN